MNKKMLYCFETQDIQDMMEGKSLSKNVIILLIILAILFGPIIFMAVKDWLGFNSNKFYGDELNKKTNSKKTTKFDEQEKSSFWTHLFRGPR